MVERCMACMASLLDRGLWMGGLIFQGLWRTVMLVSGRVAIGRSDVQFFHCDFFRVSSPVTIWTNLIGGRNWTKRGDHPKLGILIYKVACELNKNIWAMKKARFFRVYIYGIIIHHYKDLYQTTSIMESKKVFFVLYPGWVFVPALLSRWT